MPFFGKIMENVRKHRDIKLVAIERRRNYLVLEPYFHTTKFFREKVLAIEINKTEIVMNRPVYLGPSILELSIILMYEFRYDYVKPKYDKNAKLFDLQFYTQKQIIFIKILQKMLKLGLVLQIMNQIDLKEKIKNQLDQ